MTTEQTSHEPSRDATHAPGDHGAPDGHDDLVHAEEALGPVDVQAWLALVVGVGAGLLVVLCLVITTRLLVAPAI